jgi:hypothetical protein
VEVFFVSILVLLDRWWWLDRCWADECGFGGLLMAGSWWVLFGCLVCDDGGYGLPYFSMMVASQVLGCW